MLKHLKEVLGLFFPSIGKLFSPIPELALRDAILADHRIRKSSSEADPIILPQDGDSLYSVFRAAQQLFGWRYGESFDKWGERLKRAELYGPAASEFNLMQHSREEHLSHPLDHFYVQAPLASTKVRNLLQFLLQFWIEFHAFTKDKNTFIAQGGDEDRPGIITNQWHKNIDSKLWASIIENNQPNKYPNFKKLTKAERDNLREVIHQKHIHAKEVERLKNCYLKSPKYIKPDLFTPLMTAALLSTAEFNREEVGHSLYIGDENQARHLYQLLLEIAAERLIRRALINAGIDQWGITDVNKAKEIILLILDQLKGTFHGPERHLSGNGPIQIHYNAAATTLTSSLINTHLYFEFP
jgi:hypothetical protein